MALSPDVELLYEITLAADDILSEVAREGQNITSQDISDCVTACVRQWIPNDESKQQQFIHDILAYQINLDFWKPDMEEPEE